MSQVTEQQLEDMEALFVQTAASMTSDSRASARSLHDIFRSERSFRLLVTLRVTSRRDRLQKFGID